MTYLKYTLGIIVVLCTSRLLPHPPNFTSLIALSFYVPATFGSRYISSILIGLFISDIFLGLHTTMMYTFLSVVCIGLTSNYLRNKIIYRIIGCLFGAILFFMISNFGVWTSGSYGYTIEGLILCYTLAIPFFYGTILSALLYSILIEMLLKTPIKNFFIENKIQT